MHIAYSAIGHKKTKTTSAQIARYDGYHAACQKHADTIAEIRRYMPDFAPRRPEGVANGREQLLRAI